MSKSVVMMLVLVFLTVSSIVKPLTVKAESKTIVVPDDYPTLSLAIQNAGAGDTVFVKRGTYHEESININKSISLIGEGINETVLSLNPPLVETNYFHNWIWIPDKAIKINANDVKIQGFTINLPKDNYGGVGSGIQAVGNAISFTNNIVANRSVYMRGSTLNITGNSIPGALEVEGSKTTIANNTIEYTLKVQGTFNLISANKVGSSYWNGIILDGAFNCVVGNVFFSMSTEDSNYNVIINNSFANLRMVTRGEGGCNNNIISKNRITGIGSSNDGIHLSYGGNNTTSGNSIRDCDSGLTLTGAVTETSVYLNNFINNTVNIKYYGDYADWTLTNRFDNGVKGNYYDDYKGADNDGDGVGDVPYTIRGRRWDNEAGGVVSAGFAQDRYPLMAPFDIDGFSVKLPEWASGVLNTFPESEIESFPTTLVIVSIVSVAVISVGSLVYFKKHKR